ncbi:MAG: GspE/PulE family protein [Patescibacteria group bacterium]|nr:GspE/PulE family protein [Patescibacteria group bacterium]MDD5490666.1 GspE/PulE family protein [Patescibacteria group bacterium]
MFDDSQIKILEELEKKGFLSREQKEKVLSQSEEKTLVEVLLGQGLVEEEKFAEAEAVVFNFSYISLLGKEIKPEVLSIVPKNIAENYKMIAFEREKGKVKVGLVDPKSFEAQEAMDFLAGENNLKVEYAVISDSSFKEAFKKYDSIGKEVEKVLGAAKEKFGPEVAPGTQQLDEVPEGLESEDVIKKAPVAQIVSVIIRHAVEGGASDIHIEPGREETRVRYRIDGMLRTNLKLPIYLHQAIISRIKVLANLRLDETRVPQDGRIRLRINDRDVDFRVSSIPVVDNEKIAMRILETKAKALALADLGFHPWIIKVIERNIKKANGMFLITGPTGSGKSTTLYTVLNMLNDEKVNISTLEDPVEYFIRGVNQSQINPEVGFTFATGLRALLRQDPNVIMVGEIRDGETGELAIHAGLTGHLVFSTIHTRDSFGVIPRLIDMKLEPFLIASTLNAVVAQRLVRKICEHCKIEADIPPDMEKNLRKKIEELPKEALPKGVDLSKPLKFYKGKGCPRCGNLGYKGRSVIAEILEITPEMQKIIVSGYKTSDVKEETKRQKIITMNEDSLVKALEGVTTVDEILRVTQED